MRWSTVVLAGCLAPLVGCTLAQNAVHNIINEPREYLDGVRLNRDIRKEARVAWTEYCRIYPDRAVCVDMADGFMDGYRDYLVLGGTAQPPAVPPGKYQTTRYLTPEGHLRAQEYLAGFKIGLDVACASGRRQWLTVPVLFPESTQEPLLNVRQVSQEMQAQMGIPSQPGMFPPIEMPPMGVPPMVPQPGVPPMGMQPGMPPMVPQPGMPPMGVPPMAPQPGVPPMAPQPGMPPMGMQPGPMSSPLPQPRKEEPGTALPVPYQPQTQQPYSPPNGTTIAPEAGAPVAAPQVIQQPGGTTIPQQMPAARPAVVPQLHEKPAGEVPGDQPSQAEPRRLYLHPSLPTGSVTANGQTEALPELITNNPRPVINLPAPVRPVTNLPSPVRPVRIASPSN